MNYTTELEGKLQGLAVETDKLSSQLTSLNKQEGKLRASKADLEQQVRGHGVGAVVLCGLLTQTRHAAPGHAAWLSLSKMTRGRRGAMYCTASSAA